MAKAKKASLPKKVAGVKIPKSVRKNPALVRLAQKPKLAQLAAAGLVAAVGAVTLKDNASVKKTLKTAKVKAGEAVSSLSEKAKARKSLKGKSAPAGSISADVKAAPI